MQACMLSTFLNLIKGSPCWRMTELELCNGLCAVRANSSAMCHMVLTDASCRSITSGSWAKLAKEPSSAEEIQQSKQ